ncbi:unnamed protein product [Protopolystoma xenopodis]|uniref:Uncharacterized protein n=1 Tax=Protopolystoma xenopodis TaxID=117903 RepID=A0A3S5C3N8_9PLAT|nr:unnamed protein product [Protopolystoma xenopodis]
MSQPDRVAPFNLASRSPDQSHDDPALTSRLLGDVQITSRPTCAFHHHRDGVLFSRRISSDSSSSNSHFSVGTTTAADLGAIIGANSLFCQPSSTTAALDLHLYSGRPLVSRKQ